MEERERENKRMKEEVEFGIGMMDWKKTEIEKERVGAGWRGKVKNGVGRQTESCWCAE